MAGFMWFQLLHGLFQVVAARFQVVLAGLRRFEVLVNMTEMKPAGSWSHTHKNFEHELRYENVSIKKL